MYGIYEYICMHIYIIKDYESKQKNRIQEQFMTNSADNQR